MLETAEYKSVKNRKTTALAILVILFFGFLLSELGLLNSSLWPGSWFGGKQENSVARLIQKNSVVRFRSNKSLSWVDSPLYQEYRPFDIISTGDKSTAWLEFKDTTRIFMNPNTMIELGADGQGANPFSVTSTQGTFQILVQSKTFKVGPYVIKATGNSRFVVGPNHETTLADGSATISGGGFPEMSLQLGKAVHLTTAIGPTWLLPQGNMIYYTREPSTEVQFQWTNNAQKLVVSNLGTTPTKDYEFLANGQSQKAIKLFQGTYVVQLYGGDSKSEPRELKILQAPDIDLGYPRKNGRVSPKGKFHLAWSARPVVKSFNWQISKNGDFSQIVAQGETAEKKVTLQGIPRGKYFWRVKGKDANGFEIPEKQTQAFRSGIVFMAKLKPVLEMPATVPEIQAAKPKKKMERFAASVPETQTVQKIEEIQVEAAKGPPTVWTAL